MRTTTILSVTALMLASFTTALPAPVDSASLSSREAGVSTIQARGLSPEDKEKYLKMKEYTVEARKIEETAHDYSLEVLKEKDVKKKEVAKSRVKAQYALLCKLWTDIETYRIHISKQYGDNELGHMKEIAGAEASKKRYCAGP